MFGRNKKKHMFYNLNWVRQRSTHKYKNAIDRYVLLLKKLERDGDNLWLAKTFEKAEWRLQKYGISRQQLLDALERKGLTRLDSLIQYNNG